ncbi:hypothetical protein D922_02490 [Enterococcus faecalis 06-MB-DW-09]|nr:hypothetical protein D922_02490 [Enterococcus faecalis 06-MB-DW-09]
MLLRSKNEDEVAPRQLRRTKTYFSLAGYFQNEPARSNFSGS